MMGDDTRARRVDDEKHLLSAMISGADSARGCLEAALSKVDVSDFERQEYRQIFEVMKELHDESRPVDMATVGDRLAKNKQYDAVRVLLFVGNDMVFHWQETMRRVIRNSDAARIARLGETLQQRASQPAAEPSNLAESAMDILVEVAGRNRADDSQLERARAFTESIRRAAKAKERRPKIPTGFRQLDNLLGGGLSYQHFVIAAARPNMGKTALALNMAWEAIQNGKRVLIISLEQPENAIRERMVSFIGDVLNRKVQDPATMDDEELDKALDAAARLETDLLVIDDSPKAPSQLLARIAYEKRAHGLDLCIIDHIGKARYPAKRDLRHEIGELSARLADAAKANNICVLALCQLNRVVDSAGDKRPKISHLRESGNLEQDADQIFLLYREAYYSKDGANDKTAELEVAKNRSGVAGETVRLEFDGAYVQFVDSKGADSFGGRKLSKREQKDAADIAGMGA